MVDFFDIWDVIASVLSLTGGLLVHYIYKQLPSNKYQVLEELLADTSKVFTDSTEKGLLDGVSVAEFARQMARLREDADTVGFQTRQAKSLYDNVVFMLGGLTSKIDDVCNDVMELRCDISTRSLCEAQRQVAVTSATVAQDNQAAPPPTQIDAPPLGFSLGTPPEAPVAESPVVDPSPSDMDIRACASPGSVADSSTQCHMPSDEPNARSLRQADHYRTGPFSTALPHDASHSLSMQRSGNGPSTLSSTTQSRATPRRKHSIGTPLSRARVLARFVRQARKQRSTSLRSQETDTTGLLLYPSLVLVDEPSADWVNMSDLEDDAEACSPLT